MKEYRINGFQQLECFYAWTYNNADKQVKPQHISLYMFLFMENNRRNWVEHFTITYEDAMQASGIGSKSTFYNTLHDLADWGLIAYVPGVNRIKAPVISIIQLSKNGLLPVPLPEPLHIPQGAPLPEPLPIHYNISSKEVSSNGVTDHVQLTDLQTEQLAMKYRLNVKQVQAYTEQVVAYYTGIGKPIANLQSLVSSWIIKDQTTDKAKPAKADNPSPTYRKL